MLFPHAYLDVVALHRTCFILNLFCIDYSPGTVFMATAGSQSERTLLGVC